MGGGENRTKLRSFLIGGVIGASAAIAAARRAESRSARKPAPQPGLAAFESAPCFHENVDAAPPRG